MPCFGTSTPAYDCPIGSALAKVSGTVCSICYAAKPASRYNTPVVDNAMRRRLALVREAMADPIACFEWVDAFAYLLNERRRRWRPGMRNDARYFRWHDSGDLQGMRHLEMVAQVAAETPEVKHWLPTRELPLVMAYLRLHGAFPPNLRIRQSAAKLGQPAPYIPELGGGSSVHFVDGEPVAGALECGAPTRDGQCGPCRLCWESPMEVSYRLH